MDGFPDLEFLGTERSQKKTEKKKKKKKKQSTRHSLWCGVTDTAPRDQWEETNFRLRRSPDPDEPDRASHPRPARAVAVAEPEPLGGSRAGPSRPEPRSPSPNSESRRGVWKVLPVFRHRGQFSPYAFASPRPPPHVFSLPRSRRLLFVGPLTACLMSRLHWRSRSARDCRLEWTVP